MHGNLTIIKGGKSVEREEEVEEAIKSDVPEWGTPHYIAISILTTF